MGGEVPRWRIPSIPSLPWVPLLFLLATWAGAPLTAQEPPEGGSDRPAAEADGDTPADSTAPADPATATPELPTIRAGALQGDIEVDGVLDEGEWRSAPPATGFTAQQPTEGEEPREPTEVRILYNQEAIYVGARLYESDPSRIRDQLVRRDQNGQFDFFAVLLDSNLDRRTGFYFQVSARGVESDRLLFDDTQEDPSWDAIWDSGVSRDSEGWSVEMRIPLSQIRYEPSEEPQTWGVNSSVPRPFPSLVASG